MLLRSSHMLKATVPTFSILGYNCITFLDHHLRVRLALVCAVQALSDIKWWNVFSACRQDEKSVVLRHSLSSIWVLRELSRTYEQSVWMIEVTNMLSISADDDHLLRVTLTALLSCTTSYLVGVSMRAKMTSSNSPDKDFSKSFTKSFLYLMLYGVLIWNNLIRSTVFSAKELIISFPTTFCFSNRCSYFTVQYDCL